MRRLAQIIATIALVAVIVTFLAWWVGVRWPLSHTHIRWLTAFVVVFIICAGLVSRWLSRGDRRPDRS